MVRHHPDWGISCLWLVLHTFHFYNINVIVVIFFTYYLNLVNYKVVFLIIMWNLSSTLYNLYAANHPIHPDTLVAKYAGDSNLSIHIDPLSVSASLQNHFKLLGPWYFHRRLKINEYKLIHTTYNLKLQQPPPILLNNELISYSNTV